MSRFRKILQENKALLILMIGAGMIALLLIWKYSIQWSLKEVKTVYDAERDYWLHTEAELSDDYMVIREQCEIDTDKWKISWKESRNEMKANKRLEFLRSIRLPAEGKKSENSQNTECEIHKMTSQEETDFQKELERRFEELFGFTED